MWVSAYLEYADMTARANRKRVLIDKLARFVYPGPLWMSGACYLIEPDLPGITRPPFVQTAHSYAVKLAEICETP